MILKSIFKLPYNETGIFLVVYGFVNFNTHINSQDQARNQDTEQFHCPKNLPHANPFRYPLPTCSPRQSLICFPCYDSVFGECHSLSHSANVFGFMEVVGCIDSSFFYTAE